MSTRCQLGFYDKIVKPEDLNSFNALIYRHSDGYPSGVLPDIVPFVEWFKGVRGLNDSEYLSARLLQYICKLYDEMTIEMNEEFIQKPSYQDSVTRYKQENRETIKWTGKLGHGISKDFHWDIEYIYAISPDAIQVFETHYGEDAKPDLSKSKLLFSYKFAVEDREAKLEKYLAKQS